MMNRQMIIEAAGEDDPARIYKLQLTNRSFKAISGLKEFDKLRCLILGYNLIEKIENIGCLSDLRELNLENNSLEKMGGMEAHKLMQVLNLANNRIEVTVVRNRKLKGSRIWHASKHYYSTAMPLANCQGSST